VWVRCQVSGVRCQVSGVRGQGVSGQARCQLGRNEQGVTLRTACCLKLAGCGESETRFQESGANLTVRYPRTLFLRSRKMKVHPAILMKIKKGEKKVSGVRCQAPRRLGWKGQGPVPIWPSAPSLCPLPSKVKVHPAILMKIKEVEKRCQGPGPRCQAGHQCGRHSLASAPSLQK
jgi:hypothetical protein